MLGDALDLIALTQSHVKTCHTNMISSSSFSSSFLPSSRPFWVSHACPRSPRHDLLHQPIRPYPNTSSPCIILNRVQPSLFRSFSLAFKVRSHNRSYTGPFVSSFLQITCPNYLSKFSLILSTVDATLIEFLVDQ